MILKYIRNSFFKKVEYLNVPSDTIMNRQIINENDESWVIVLDSDYYEKNYNTIFGKCQIDVTVQIVSIEEWTFIFLYNIKPYEWVSMPDEVFKCIFDEFFKHIYIYETLLSESKLKKISEHGFITKDLEEEYKKCIVTSRAQKIRHLDRCRFEVTDISWTDSLGRDMGMCIRTDYILPCDIAKSHSYKSEIYISRDPYEFDCLMRECYEELGFDEWVKNQNDGNL